MTTVISPPPGPSGPTPLTTALIVAADEDDVIGSDGRLPWHHPADLQRFKRLTMGHVVVAGRRTHESIVDRLGRPLPGRITVVLTRRPHPAGRDTVIYQPDIESALSVARAVEAFAGRDTVYVIGGGEVYAQALPEVDLVCLTRVHDRHVGDVRLPGGWLDGFELVGTEGGPEGQGGGAGKEQPDARLSYLTYRRR
jgi:dihydrofolate reductase